MTFSIFTGFRLWSSWLAYDYPEVEMMHLIRMTQQWHVDSWSLDHVTHMHVKSRKSCEQINSRSRSQYNFKAHGISLSTTARKPALPIEQISEWATSLRNNLETKHRLDLALGLWNVGIQGIQIHHTGFISRYASIMYVIKYRIDQGKASFSIPLWRTCEFNFAI